MNNSKVPEQKDQSTAEPGSRLELLELFFQQTLEGFFFMFLDEPVEWGPGFPREPNLSKIYSNLRVLRANEAMARQYGLSAEQMVGKDMDFFFAGNRGHGLETISEMLDSGHTHLITHETDKNGVEVIIEGDYLCLYDSQARIRGCFGAQREITKAFRMQERLKELNETLVKRNPDEIANISLLVQLAGRSLGAQCAWYGRLEHGWLETLADWNLPLDFPRKSSALEGICSEVIANPEGEALSLTNLQESPIVKKDSRLKRAGWQGFLGTSIKCQGTPLGALCLIFSRNFVPDEADLQFFSLLSSAIEAEEDRRHSLREREHLQSQLLHSQKMESLGRLAGGVAHDFNNLLGPIIGYADMLIPDLEKEPDLQDQVKEILQAAQRARDLTQQLLALGRKQILEVKTLHLNDVIQQFMSIMHRTIRENITLQFRAGKDLSPVRLDPGQFEQVLMNLVVNAQDAMPGGGSLILETSQVELDDDFAQTHQGVIPGSYLRLTITDTGVGMSAHVKEHLFEPFFTTKEKGKGTGLGLSTVYGIVKQHGGHLWVYSEPDLGTTFKIDLPISPDFVERETVKVTKPLSHRGTETILVVEDNDIVRNLTRGILEKNGFKVLVGRDGEDGLQQVQTYGGVIQLLLTDVIMPGINGRELYEKIKLLRPGMRVLYMSGYTADVIAHHGIMPKGLGFIQKPFTMQTLTERVRMVLDEKIDADQDLGPGD